MKRLRGLLTVSLVALLSAPAGAQSNRAEAPVAPGLSYLRVQRPGPLLIHLLRAELTEPSLKVGVAVAGPRLLDTQPLSELIAGRAESATVAGGINGGHSLPANDSYHGAPAGLLIVNGELLCDPWPAQRSALLIGQDGKPRIEVVGLRGRLTGSDNKPQRLGGLNRRRLPGEMVLYTPRFNASTRILEPGQQVVVTGALKDGRLEPQQSYRGQVAAIVDGRVNVEIPADGVVIAGSGPAAAWLAQRKVGEEVSFQFELVPELGSIASAIGAGPRLVRDSEVSVEADVERLAISRDSGRQPRSAVGFNDRYLFLVAVDGRNPDVSVGIGVEDLARYLVELGCTQAMELEGGGATTLFARDRVMNHPSDGEQRSLSNALLLYTSAGLSARPLPAPTMAAGGAAPPAVPAEPLPALPAPATEPAAPVGPAARIAKVQLSPDEVSLAAGESVVLEVAVLDNAGQPVEVGPADLRWDVAPSALGTVGDGCRFTAQSAGIGRISVRVGDVTATSSLKVTRASAPAASTPAAPAEPPAMQPELIETPVTPPLPPARSTTPEGATPTAPGEASPPAEPGPGAGVERDAPELPTGERRLIDGFEQARHWGVKRYPESTPGELAVVAQNIRIQGTHCAKLTYDFTLSDGIRAVYAVYDKVIGFPKAVSVYVFGDGKGHWLRGRFRDKDGKAHVVTFTRYINWDHQWRRVSAVMPAGIAGPITWESFYVAQHEPEVKSAGSIYLDQFEGIY